MSGGHFNYEDSYLDSIAEQLEQDIKYNDITWNKPVVEEEEQFFDIDADYENTSDGSYTDVILDLNFESVILALNSGANPSNEGTIASTETASTICRAARATSCATGTSA